MKYVLEPMLFAFDEDLSEQELIDYLTELLALDNWWDMHSEDMYVQDSTSDVLFMNNYYPTGDSLKPLLEKHRINYIQYGDVEKIIVKMLTHSKKIKGLFSEMCSITKQTLKQDFAVKPQVKRSDVLNDELLKLFGNVFLAHANGGCDEKSFVVITKGISDIVSVEYEYEVIEGDEEEWSLVEKTGTQEVNCKASLADFLQDTQTPFLLWKTAERKDDLDLGVRVAVLQLNGNDDLDSVNKDYSFTIQDSFYEDYCDGHYRSKDQDIRSTIQAVTYTLTEQNLAKVHAIRTGKKGNDPQLVINNYGAQRRDITTSIKLAYWKKGREYKIANMREHDFFEPTWEP